MLSVALARAFGWLTGNTTHLLLAALLLTGAWGWAERERAVKYHDESIAFTAAQKKADALEQARLQAVARQVARDAQEAQAHETQDLSVNLSAGDSYKRAHSLRSGSGTPNGVPATQGDAPAVPIDAPADALVVSGKDFDACTADATYAVNAYLWALSLSETFDK